MLSAGGVISNYLALGAGRAFLINDIEIATAQLWVRPDQGVRTFADLKGRRVATTTKTTAHIFLDRALRANNIDPSDVELVNGSMPDAVASFIAGTVPAVALWVPFNISGSRGLAGRHQAGGCVRLLSRSPPSSAAGSRGIDYYDDNKEVLGNIIRAWADANDYIVRNPAAAAEALQKNHYTQASVSDIAEALKAQKMFTSREWRRLYVDGTVAKWLQQVSDFFMTDAGITGAKPASEYFDPDLYLSVI